MSGTEVRLAWLETHVERAPPLGTSATATTAAGVNADGSEPKGDDEAVAAHDRSVDDGIPAEGTLASEREGGGQRAAGTSPTLAWASLVEEEGNSAGGGTTTDGEDGEIERLWCRMHKVEARIYQARADEKRLQPQVFDLTHRPKL